MLKFCYLAVSVLGLTYIAYAIRRSNQPLFGSSDVFDDQIMANYAICLFVFFLSGLNLASFFLNLACLSFFYVEVLSMCVSFRF